MSIVRLVPAHASAYRALMMQAYADHPDAFTTSPAERTDLPLAWWEARLAAGGEAGEVVFGAMLGTQLVGAAGLGFSQREKERHKAHLFGMVVRAEARGLGFGRQLVEAVLAHARTRPEVRLVQLTVTEGNLAAEGLYRRCGFASFGVEPLAMRLGDAYLNKLHMWRDLRAA